VIKDEFWSGDDPVVWPDEPFVRLLHLKLYPDKTTAWIYRRLGREAAVRLHRELGQVIKAHKPD